MSPPAQVTAAQPDKKMLRKLMFAGVVGSSIEWYDFFIYGTAAALVFGHVFFPGSSPIIGTLLAFSTFWAGFIARPLGGVVFGYVGDRIGRKPAVVTCLVAVTAGTFLIGVLPSASTIGVLAPILLVLLRFIQGIAVGGQWGGVILLLTEHAMPGRRGRAGTFGQMGVPGGLLLGTTAFLLTASLLGGEAFVNWGWRIPFLASALLLPVVLFIQNKVEDTPVFQELKQQAEQQKAQQQKAQQQKAQQQKAQQQKAQQQKAQQQKQAEQTGQGENTHGSANGSPVKDVLRKNWRNILLGAGVLFSSNAIFYVGVAGVLDYGTRVLGLSRDSLLQVTLLASAVGIFFVFIAGSASDRFGRKPLMIAGTATLVAWAFPYFWLVDTASLWLIFVAVLIGSLGSSLVYGPYAAFLAEFFNPQVRYSGMSISYQLTAILISGGTPFIMTALLATFGTSMAVSGYLFALGLLSLGCALAVNETLPSSGRVGSSSKVSSRQAATSQA